MSDRLVSDVMQRKVVTLRAGASVREAESLLAHHRIGGAPVVAAADRVLGIVTQTDLVRFHTHRPTASEIGAFWTDDEGYDELAEICASDALVKVEQLMTRDVLGIAPGASLREAAHLMREHHIHRLLVIEDGVLRGIITTFDLLRAVDETP
jgi:CBS domain-containing protein